MKKILKPYIIIIIFLLVCTGCNKNHDSGFIHLGGENSQPKSEITRYKSGAIMMEDDSAKSGSTKMRFDIEDVDFGPKKIKFGAEEHP